VSIALLAKSLRAMGIDARRAFQTVSRASLQAAIVEQRLDDTVGHLRRLVPDPSDQYSHDFDSAEFARYWELKMRGLQAFQVNSALEAIARIGRANLTLADIGDSSGNHGIYIRGLAAQGQVGRYVSVNMDPIAVEKIRRKGGTAELSRAEGLPENLEADLYLSFETVEHLTDPLRFFHSLSARKADVIFSVPFCRSSRFGGHMLRQPLSALPESLTPEVLHIFELSPTDWRLLTHLAGFRCLQQRVYLQYPCRHPLRITRLLWRRLDFEGFVTFHLTPDENLSRRYTGW
jgi:hypothetical protein